MEFKLQENRAEGEAIGEMRNVLKTMHGLLAVRDAPATWPDLLEPEPDTRGDRDDRDDCPPPGDG